MATDPTKIPTAEAIPSPEGQLSVAENGDQQDGVRVAEAVTASWSKKSLIITYAW
jgi:hypothetical protein